MRNMMCRVLGITKQGSRYLRKMLIQGARSAMPTLAKANTAVGAWLRALLMRAQARCCGHRSDRPIGGILGRTMQRAFDYRGNLIVRYSAGPTGAVFVGQTLDPVLYKSPAPLANSVLMHPEPRTNLLALNPSAQSKIILHQSESDRVALCRRICASRKARSSSLRTTSSAKRPTIASSPDIHQINDTNYSSG